MAKRGGLGRGLDSLLGAAKAPKVSVDAGKEVSPEEATRKAAVKKRSVKKAASKATETAPQQKSQPVSEVVDSEGLRSSLKSLPRDLMQRGQYQPRREFDKEALEELANSIRAQGVIQPIVVRPYGEPGRYEIVAGERRWRAAQLAGLQEIPVVIKEVSDQATMAMALIENIQRENLNPIEEATALQRLIQEFELTQQQAADAVGRSRTAVTNLLRLLHLNAEVRVLLEKSRLEMGHARALLGLQGKAQSDAAKQVVLLGLSVRETEKLVRKMLHPTKVTNKVAEEADPNVRALQNQLSEQLGATVVVKQGQKGRGQLVIQYNSLDELDGILTHIQ